MEKLLSIFKGRILDNVQFEPSYRASLTKRFRQDITADDFLKFSSRFANLCNQIYHRTTPELRFNDFVPCGLTELVFVSQERLETRVGRSLNDLGAKEADFDRLFQGAQTVILNLKPAEDRVDLSSSFARVIWSIRTPQLMLFYADQNSPKTPSPLQDLLYKRMFYVKDSAPNLFFGVKLGVKATIDALINP